MAFNIEKNDSLVKSVPNPKHLLTDISHISYHSPFLFFLIRLINIYLC